MALVLQDRVKETSSSTGTSNFTLGGAFIGYRTFNSCIPTGSTVYYCIHGTSAGIDGEFEVGYGTFTAPATLSRTSVFASSNADALVNFSAGDKEVFITYPAEKAIYEEVSGETIIDGGPITVIGSNVTSYTSFASTLAEFYANENNFAQLYAQNLNNGSDGSTDIAAYNNLGDGTFFFVDMGITSSTYNSALNPIFNPNDAYVYSYGNATTVSRLLLGTQSPGANVVIFTGGVNVNSTALTISGTDQSATFANNVSVTANVSAANGVFTSGAYVSSNTALITASNQVTSKAYVDAAVATGFVVKTPVNLATTAVLSGTPTYNNGASGVGATLTAAGVGTLSVDGQNAASGFRILVKSQANAAHNGVYSVTVEGTIGTPYVLTRTTDFDTAAPGEIANNAYFFVSGGNTLIGFSFVLSQLAAITVGTTALPFTEFASQLTYTGTAPINVAGQTISLTGTVGATNGGTGANTVATGDLLYGSGTNAWAKLPRGSAYASLLMNASGTQVEWNALPLNQAAAISGALGPTNGGTGQSSYTLGDTLYSSAANTLAKLPGNTTTTKRYLQQQGDGVNSAAPSWQQIANSDITGLGTMSTQNANSVTITGGTLNNVAIGGTTANTAVFTTANATTFNGTTVNATSGNFTNVSGNGVALTAINASNISSGTIANARTTASDANGASTIVSRDANGSFGANVITATFSGNGATLSAINASNISSGTIANARTTAASANGASTIVQRDSSGNFTANVVTATHVGDGSGLSNINASNIASGTIANARTTAATANGASTIVLRGSSGEFAAGAITATSLSGNGSAITAINATAITTGTIANARTTADSANGASTIVARDAGGNFSANTITATTFSGAHSGNGASLTNINASNISSGTIANARTTASDANGASTIVARDANGSFSANIITANGSAISAINGSNVTTGTVANARTTAATANGASTIVLRGTSGEFSAGAITGASFTGSGSGLTSIPNSATTATSANGASTIVARDASGNFSANTPAFTKLTVTPNTSGVSTGLTVVNGDITTYRSGGTTGVIYLSSASDRYLYWDGTNYNLPGGSLIATAFTGNGAAISAINASNISSGTIANARTTAASANGASTIVTRDANGDFSARTITANLTGTASSATTAANASLLNSISAVNLFNNMGQTHPTYTQFNAQGTALSTDFGYRFIQGNTNGPGTNGATQYYAWNIGLGSEYPFNQYAAQFAIGRDVTTPYLSVRYEEAGVLKAWQKISAGFADSATSATTATTATNLSGGTVSATTVQATGGFTATSAAPFYTNATTVSSNYTVPASFNAMSAGPITINTGVTVTVSTGSSWVVV
jgi:hypothetical protein